MSDQSGSFLEYRQRVIFSLFRAASRVGIRLRLPLGEMQKLFRMAYLREARAEQKLELQPIADLFGKSLRTVSSLHKKFQTGFFAPEREVQFRRDIAALVDRGPCTREQLQAAFSDRTESELDLAVEDLVREGTALRDGDLLRRNPSKADFYDERDIVRRVDGLNRQMDVLAETVWGRLLAPPDEDGGATARTYVFTATDEEYARLMRELLTRMKDDVIAADAAAQDAGVPTKRAITLASVTLEPDP